MKNQADKEIKWKDILAIGLAHSDEQISAERKWSQVCSLLRDLCPETEWISIAQIGVKANAQLIDESITILKKMIAHPTWPFPKKVILSLNSSESFGLRILLDGQHKLNTTISSEILSVQMVNNKYASGWFFAPKEQPTRSIQGEI